MDCLVFAACGSGAEPENHVQRDTIDGVEVVLNDSVDRALAWRLEESWRVGSLDGPDALYAVREIGLAAAGGHLYVLDAGNHRVLTVDSRSGRILSQFGKEGDGPFHFRSPHSLWASADSVFVLEGRRRALVAFDAEGQPLYTEPLKLWEIGYLGPTRVGPDGWYFPIHQSGPDSTTLSLLRVSSADTATVHTSVIGGSRVIQFDDCGLTTRLRTRPLGSTELIWSAAASGVAVNGTAEYRIEILKEPGRVVTRALRPTPITQEEARELLRQTMIMTRCPVDEDWFLAQHGVAAERQVISDVALSPQGELWVRRRGLDPDRPGPADVFDSTGVYLGSLPPEAPFPVVFSPDGLFMTLEQDSVGVQSVVAYRVERR